MTTEDGMTTSPDVVDGLDLAGDGCPKCGGDNLAAFGFQLWCDDCDWITPDPVPPAWVDGDSIERLRTGETWTRSEGRWWSDLGGEPKEDSHASATWAYAVLAGILGVDVGVKHAAAALAALTDTQGGSRG